jgi:hypothetical protein
VEYPMAIVKDRDNAAVNAFYDYLKGPQAAVVFKHYGAHQNPGHQDAERQTASYGNARDFQAKQNRLPFGVPGLQPQTGGISDGDR